MNEEKLCHTSKWGTKNREPVLSKDTQKNLFHHIRDNAKEKDIYIDFVNGHVEHVHCLLALNADMTIAKTLQLIKGESAFWANKNKMVKPKLEWADEYFAVSVSESMVDKVRDYIKNQEEHHKKGTFMEEYEEFMRKFNFRSHG